MSESPGSDCQSAAGFGQGIVRTLAVAVAVPSCIVLVTGMIAAMVADPGIGRDALAEPTVALGELATWHAITTPRGMLTVGLASMAVLPAATVAILAVAQARAGRWREAIIAAGVLAMLVVAASFGHR